MSQDGPNQPKQPEKTSSARLTRHWTIGQVQPLMAVLATALPLSKNRLKDCLDKGCVWLKRPGHGERRVRKASFMLQPGDRLSLYYDANVLATVPPPPRCLADTGRYSVWDKPALLLAQGSQFGDHCSLLRHVELQRPNKVVYLLHRLDREARGLMLLAHDQQAAAAISRLFQLHQVDKRYQARVHGILGLVGETISLDTPLDGKVAATLVTILRHDMQNMTSLVDVRINTGRLHQIRRHLSGLGYPLLGDKRYGGQPPGNQLMLQLLAYQIAFRCPLTGQQRCYQLPDTELF